MSAGRDKKRGRRSPQGSAAVRPADTESPVAPPLPDGTRLWTPAWLAFLAAVFVVKLVVVAQLKDHPLTQADVGLDTSAYVALARRVLGGDLSLGPGLYFLSPLYIYFLAAGLAIGSTLTFVRVVQIALGTAAVAFVFLIGREWFGRRAAWIAAALAAATGLFTFYEALIFQAALDPVLTAAALYGLTRAVRSGDRRWLVLTGLLFALAALNRPNMLLAAGGVVALLAWQRRWTSAVAIAAGLAIGLAPSLIRNVVVSHEWTMSSSHGGLNFYIGNHDNATGFYRLIPGIRPDISGQSDDVRRVASQALGRPVSESAASQYFYDQAWNWIAREPGAALALTMRKIGYVFAAQHIALPYSYPFYVHDASTILKFLPVGPWLLIPLGLVGLVAAAPRAERRAYLIWVSFVPVYAIAVAIFFISERYRLPLLVPLVVGAGAAIDMAMRAVAARQTRALAAPLAAIAIVGAFANWPRALGDGRWEEGLRMAQRLVILGRDAEASEWAEKLERTAAQPGSGELGVGMQYLVQGRPEPALPHLERALARKPGVPQAEYALGQALLGVGRAAEAIPHLRRGFDAGVEVPLGGYDLAVALERTGDLAGAAEAIRRIPVPDGPDPEAPLRLGRLASQVRAPELAEPYFRRAVAIAPTQASARQQLGLNLTVLGRFEEAARELAEAARLEPRDADTLAHLAYCELQLGRIDDARRHLDAALSVNPTHPLAAQIAARIGK
ncbi:MAG TPA: tetratricopeptide repeat protein [Vicinamibacterales bacterium]|nr:tetratricopeptide repeat protein [Vicinamibacterales bacterium]